jgi:hypothetical protein
MTDTRSLNYSLITTINKLEMLDKSKACFRRFRFTSANSYFHYFLKISIIHEENTKEINVCKLFNQTKCLINVCKLDKDLS